MRKTNLPLWDKLNMDDGIQLAARDRYYYEHQRRLQSIRPSINIDTPRNFPKLQGNKIGTFTNEQYLEITRNNQRLLKRLTTISHKKTRFSKMKKSKKAQRSLNKNKKKQETDRINRENRYLVSRIMNCKSTINHKKINKDWNRHRNIIRNHSIAKQKRKSFRPNRLSPLSNTSSSRSTPMMSPRIHLNDIDIHNLSPNTLQKLIALQSPLDTIIEKSDDIKSTLSSHPPYQIHSFRDKYVNETLAQISNLSLNNRSQSNTNSTNIIFSERIKHNEDIKVKEQEDEDMFEEVGSDWELDEEWLQKETKTSKPRQKMISIGLPLI